MTINNLSWQIGGAAGDGVEIGGQVLALALARSGLEVFTYRNYPSRIRGGYTSFKIRVSEEPVLSRGDDLDVLVALSQDAVDDAYEDLAPGAVIIYDESEFNAQIPEDKHLNVYPAPLEDIAEDAGGRVMRNTAGLGVTAELLGIPRDTITSVISERFEERGQEVIDSNRRALEAGGDHARDNIQLGEDYRVRPLDRKRYLIGGDESIGFGALAAGCRFMSAYPITPSTYVMQWMASELPEHGGVMVQAEDEIAAAHMAIGAGYAGVRAMTATSGPGMSLMTEAMSLAGMTETPVVFVDGMRPGPSTGLPTKHEQGDIGHLVHGGHGDFPRIILAPGSAEECFHLTVKAFNLAERYQLPVFIAIDNGIAVSMQTTEGFQPGDVAIVRDNMLPTDGIPGDYDRYEYTESGVSQRTVPGQPGGYSSPPAMNIGQMDTSQRTPRPAHV